MIEVDSAAIVGDCNLYTPRLVGSFERHTSGRIFSGCSPLIRCFDAVRDGIAHQVQKGIGNHIGERFLDAHVSAPNLKFYLLSQMINCDSAGTRGGALENFACVNLRVLTTFAQRWPGMVLGFSDHTPALLFYVIVGGAGLLATLATRFESPASSTRPSMVPEAA